MSIVVAVKTHNGIAIAADTLMTNGPVLASASYRVNPSKLVRHGGSIVGFVGESVTQGHFALLIRHFPKRIKLGNREEIFDSFLSVPEMLKPLCRSKAEDDDDELSVPEIHALVANQGGIFEVASEHHVIEYTRFTAIGCGMMLALGAMHALYDRCEDAATIARAGVEAACEFDSCCGLPIECCLVGESSDTRQNGAKVRKTNRVAR